MEVARYSCPACRETLDLSNARLSDGNITARCPKCFRELRLYKAVCPVFPPIEFRKELGFPKNVLTYIHEFLFSKRYHCKEKPKYLFIYKDTHKGCMELLTRCEKHKEKLPLPGLTSSLAGKFIDETID
jgi:hypothetical protein